MTDHCWSCGGGVKGAKFCPTCGLGGDGAGAFFCVLPAAVTGIAGRPGRPGRLPALLSVPVRPVGFVDGILAIALGTTLPYFDVAMGFVAGWAAVSTLRVRAATPVVAVGLLTSLLYAATLAAVSRAVGRQVAAHDLGLVLGAPALGSLLAGPLATPLGRFTRLGALVDGSPGAVYPLTALLTVVSVASLVILYGIVITAVVVTLALVAIVVAFRIAGAVMSGGVQTVRAPATSRTKASASGRPAGSSRCSATRTPRRATSRTTSSARVAGWSRCSATRTSRRATPTVTWSGRAVG